MVNKSYQEQMDAKKVIDSKFGKNIYGELFEGLKQNKKSHGADYLRIVNNLNSFYESGNKEDLYYIAKDCIDKVKEHFLINKEYSAQLKYPFNRISLNERQVEDYMTNLGAGLLYSNTLLEMDKIISK